MNKKEEVNYTHYLSESELKKLLKKLRASKVPAISINGSQAEVIKGLGSGRAKNVYDIKILDKHYALAICVHTKHESVILKLWSLALQEPKKTHQLRSLGLSVNPLVEAIIIDLDGQPFPAIIMQRYEDLDFLVFDKRNRNQDFNPLLTQTEPTSLKEFIDLVRIMLPDLATLLRNRIKIGSDSFNLSVKNKSPRLFFTDLENMMPSTIAVDDFSFYAYLYAERTIESLLDSLTDEVYDRNPIFKEADKHVGKAIGTNDESMLIRELAKEVINLI